MIHTGHDLRPTRAGWRVLDRAVKDQMDKTCKTVRCKVHQAIAFVYNSQLTSCCVLYGCFLKDGLRMDDVTRATGDMKDWTVIVLPAGI